jgi:hypothetical protein
MTPPVRMEMSDKSRFRAAAFRVTRLYPGPVGELLSREILTWEEFGYRLGGSGLMLKLVDYVLKTPLPPHETSTSVRPATQSAVGYGG